MRRFTALVFLVLSTAIQIWQKCGAARSTALQKDSAVVFSQ
jgi:hypothetical protein